jgi:hypothetical protein
LPSIALELADEFKDGLARLKDLTVKLELKLNILAISPDQLLEVFSGLFSPFIWPFILTPCHTFKEPGLGLSFLVLFARMLHLLNELLLTVHFQWNRDLLLSCPVTF